jgi:hypothetical protein
MLLNNGEVRRHCANPAAVVDLGHRDARLALDPARRRLIIALTRFNCWAVLRAGWPDPRDGGGVGASAAASAAARRHLASLLRDADGVGAWSGIRRAAASGRPARFTVTDRRADQAPA